MAATAPSRKLYFIGYNYSGEYGLGHNYQLTEFTLCPNKSITKVYQGRRFIFYTDDNFDNIWSAGCNLNGECGLNNDQQLITKYTPVTYFKKNNIKIQNIFTNPAGYCAFFQSDLGDIYGCGANDCHQLGAIKETNEPIHIPILKYVIDIKSAGAYSTALCTTNNQEILLIIRSWSREYDIPEDVTNILFLFININKVYSTLTSRYSGGGHDKDAEFEHEYGWNEIEIFKNKHIIQIALGFAHSLFLEENGTVWSYGYGNKRGETGLGIDVTEYTYIPKQIKYFIDNNIKIRDIKAGYRHNLAVDYEDRVYSWGDNECGQCGDGTRENIMIPKQIDFFKEYKVDIIGCGLQNSYVKTKSGKYFTFGINTDNKCMTFDINDRELEIPHQIDNIVRDKLKTESIGEIIMGELGTTVICE